VAAVAGLAAVAGVLAGCGSAAISTGTTSATSSGPVLARIGALEVERAYLPDPASPSVAAVYLTVRNTGATPDELLAVSSPDASTSMLMSEQDSGSMGDMAPLPSLTIPAHGEASLTPGRDHAMLQRPTTAFKVGQKVPVTLRFARAGSVTVQVPVVPLSAIVGGQGGSGSVSGMPGMSGMGG
jgi:copper(I)-binding protein